MTPTETQITQVMRAFRLDRMQAYYHLQARLILQQQQRSRTNG
jgi:hypothetical protein